MKLRQLREHEQQQLDEVSKFAGGFIGSIVGLYAGSMAGSIGGAVIGTVLGGPGVGTAGGLIVGQTIGALAGFITGIIKGTNMASGSAKDIEKWEKGLVKVKEAKELSIKKHKEFAKKKGMSSKDLKKDLDRLEMGFDKQIKKLEDAIARGKKHL
jgi:hypothetical protein